MGDDSLQIKLIGKSTVKVCLSAKELDDFGLSRESIGENESDTRKLIIYILDEILHTLGKDLSSGRLCIEIFPTSEKGCLMYISDSSSYTAAHRRRRKKRTADDTAEAPELVFSCSTAEELMGCADILRNRAGKLISRSSLFISQEDFRIVVSVAVPLHGEDFPQSITAAYTREHCSLLIADDAIERLSGLIP